MNPCRFNFSTGFQHNWKRLREVDFHRLAGSSTHRTAAGADRFARAPDDDCCGNAWRFLRHSSRVESRRFCRSCLHRVLRTWLLRSRIRRRLLYRIFARSQNALAEGYTPLESGFGLWFEHLVLPTTALSVPFIAFSARISRASILEVLSEDYMRTAAAKGASSYAMHFRHALKNASVPILTVIGISFAHLVSGVVLTETVFNIPGIGRLVVDAINNRDYPVVQGVLILVSGLYVLINLLIDLSYTLVDPRIRYL